MTLPSLRSLHVERGPARLLIVGAVLIGTGQQLVATLRNAFLIDLGWPAEDVPLVQGTGTLAGVLAGTVGFFVAPRLPPRILFAAAAVLQCAGILLQSMSTTILAVGTGAMVAGLGMHLHAAVSAPTLMRVPLTGPRTSLFSMHTLALSALAGLCAAALISVVIGVVGPGISGERTCLVLAACISLCAAAPLVLIRVPSVPISRRWGATLSPRLRRCLALDALMTLGAGLSVPLLALYLRARFNASEQFLAVTVVGTTLLGVLGQLIAPWCVQRVGLWRSVVALEVGVVPLSLVLALVETPWWAALAGVLRQVLVTAATPLLNNLQQEVASDEERPSLGAAAVMVRALCWAVGVFLASPLIAVLDGAFDAVFLGTAALYAVTAALAWRLYPVIAKT